MYGGEITTLQWPKLVSETIFLTNWGYNCIKKWSQIFVLSTGSAISERGLFLIWILKTLCDMYPKSRGPTIELFFLTRLPGPCGMNRKQNCLHIINIISDYPNTENLFQDFHKRLFLCPPGLLVRESQEEVEIDIGVTSPTSVVTGGPWRFWVIIQSSLSILF